MTGPDPAPDRGRERAKRIARAWLPPALADAARALRPDRSPRDWEYEPEGWAATAPTEGWDVESVAQAQVERWPAYLRAIEGTEPLAVAYESTRLDEHDTQDGHLPGYAYASHNATITFGYVLARAAHDRDRISVLDWGGGLGHHYQLARALLPDVELDYSCHDVPVMCRAGAELQPEIRFVDADTALAQSYDLVFASNSLQYFERWQPVVDQLAAATERFLFLTRVPVVWHVPSYVVVQRPARFGYDTEYRSWTFNRAELLAQTAASRLELTREFLQLERLTVPSVPEQWENRAFLFTPGQFTPGQFTPDP